MFKLIIVSNFSASFNVRYGHRKVPLGYKLPGRNFKSFVIQLHMHTD